MSSSVIEGYYFQQLFNDYTTPFYNAVRFVSMYTMSITKMLEKYAHLHSSLLYSEWWICGWWEPQSVRNGGKESEPQDIPKMPLEP
jgi:hypothetical protein